MHSRQPPEQATKLMAHIVVPAPVFHICSRVAAQQAMAQGHYQAPSLASEGFIHLSQRHQVSGVIAAFYSDVPDLVILVVDPARLTAPLYFEAAATMPGTPAGSDAAATGLFPHLYGPLDVAAVVSVIDADQFDPLAFS